MSAIFVLEDPTDVSSKYSGRISQKDWDGYRDRIEQLHLSGRTRRQIQDQLCNEGFCPSFGQLVAQMTRWRMMRYSKPVTSTDADTPQPSGILCLSQLLNIHPSGPVLQDDDRVSEPASPSRDNLHGFMATLNLSRVPDTTRSRLCLQQSLTSLQTAYTLFLGEAYNHAFIAYHAIYQGLSDSSNDISVEQMRVKALVGCLKSAVSRGQLETAIQNMDKFIDDLVLSPDTIIVKPTKSAEIMATWSDPDYATTKIIYDLLTYYKTARTWNTPQEMSWAHRITLIEWTCSRLVRLPDFTEAIAFLNTLPAVQETPKAIFDQQNRQDLLIWMETARENIQSLFDEQVQGLQGQIDQAPELIRILMFWRLHIFSTERPPPSLRIAMHEQSTFAMSAEATCCVLARAMCTGITSSSMAAPTLQNASIDWLQSHEEFSRRIWRSAREVFAPTRAERQEALRRSYLWIR